jgi:Holliday junction resolvase
MSHPSKRKGYAAEVRVLEVLRKAGINYIMRTGSTAYMRGGPDLINAQGGTADPIEAVAVVVPRERVLFALDEEAMTRLLSLIPWENLRRLPIYVSVKRRAKNVVLTWLKELRVGVKEFTRHAE